MKKIVKPPINILFCGTGGQGVLTASEICGIAAMLSGFHVKKSEVHGMAQRGGSVESHLRFGVRVFSPLIPLGRADFLVPFHPGERERMKHMLAPGGTDLFPFLVGAGAVNPRYRNTWLLGVLSLHLSIPENEWLAAFEAALASKNSSENRTVFLAARKQHTINHRGGNVL